MTAYYNEIDPYAAQWLRNLIAAGHIAPGDVDERSIVDVRPDDLRGYAQCHFFAGIGVWIAALRDAGWPDDKPVWTGSCPCQPFSAAGKRGGFADERHLWPAFFHLIRECRPAIVFGEQVASPDGLRWLDLVSADLEGEAYAIGAADLCAAGVCLAAGETEIGGAALEWIRGAVLSCPDAGLAAELRDFAEWFGRAGGIGPAHIRQRLCWVGVADGWHAGAERQQPSREYGQQSQDSGVGALADADQRQCGRFAAGERCEPDRSPAGRQQGDGEPECDCATGRLADNARGGWRKECSKRRGIAAGDRAEGRAAGFVPGGDAGGLGNVDDEGSQGWRQRRDGADQRIARTQGMAGGADWIICTDGKARPVEPGTFPLAHGAPARVGRLRAYGNAMHRAKIAAFIEAVLEQERLRLIGHNGDTASTVPEPQQPLLFETTT